MNIIIERDAFLFALQRVIGAVDRKTTIAVLQHVAIAATSDALRLTATNLDMQATTVCAAESDGEHAFTLPGATALDILNNLSPGGQVALSRDASDPRIILKSGRSRFKLPTLRPEDMPIMAAPEGEALRLPASALASILDASMYAVSKDAVRHYVCGVYMHTIDGAFRCVGTDFHRLAVGSVAVDVITGAATIPTGMVSEMARLLNSCDGDAELVIGASLAQLMANGAVLIGKLIDTPFPDYVRVIPRDLPHTLMVGRDAFASAIRRAMIMVSDKSRSVRLSLTADAVSVTSKNADSGEAENDVEAAWDGADMMMSFNGALLLDALGKMAGDTVSLRINNKDAAILIEEGDRLAVVMPQRG